MGGRVGKRVDERQVMGWTLIPERAVTPVKATLGAGTQTQ